MKQLITSSRSSKMLGCPRAHYWAYEVGLRRAEHAIALRFGSAWARAMDVRWSGGTAEEALSAALPEGVDLDALASETIASLLLGYYQVYGQQDTLVKQCYPEIEFKTDLARSRSFYSAGKIDGLCQLMDGRIAEIEHKTTSDSVADDSAYWIRLRFNPQILQYAFEARRLGWQIEVAIYDVTRKPSIGPKQIPVLDENGAKIVKDADGNRVFKKDGNPRESGDSEKGYTLQTEEETPEQFGQRLFEDVQARPEFYFARREIPILEQDLDEYVAQRLSVTRMILGCRSEEVRAKRPEQAWPRNIGKTCDYCEYSSFCLQNINPDLNQPPAGFVVGPTNPELTDADPTRTTPTH